VCAREGPGRPLGAMRDRALCNAAAVLVARQRGPRSRLDNKDLASPPARPWAGEQGAARIGRMYADALRF
jgi:hypothetical protein